MASKYDRLRSYLKVRTASSVVLSFREIEKILGVRYLLGSQSCRMVGQ